jgi:hypothetical protein
MQLNASKCNQNDAQNTEPLMKTDADNAKLEKSAGSFACDSRAALQGTFGGAPHDWAMTRDS